MPERVVLVLNGPVGVGKTTLGRGLAAALGGDFLDSDDLRDHRKRWIEEVLVILDRIVTVARQHRLLVVAKPLRARDWAVLRRRLADSGIAGFCVTLTADPAAILAPGRGRTFSAAEAERVSAMVAQGYGARAFSDVILRTDEADFATTLARLEAECRGLMA